MVLTKTGLSRINQVVHLKKVIQRIVDVTFNNLQSIDKTVRTKIGR